MFNSYRRKERYKLSLRLSSKYAAVRNLVCEKLGILGIEFGKILFGQKGLLFFVILIILLVQNIDFEKYPISAADDIVNSFYEEYGGKMATDAKGYLAELQDEIQKISEIGNIAKTTELKSKIKAYKIISSQIDYLENLEMNKGIQGFIVNPAGYNRLLSQSDYKNKVFYDFLAALFLILILSDIFSYERKNSMITVLKSTPLGREKLFRVKTSAAFIIAALIWALVYGTELLGVLYLFDLNNLNAPLQSNKAFYDVGISVSLGGFMFAVMLTRLLMLFAAALLINSVSVFTDNKKAIALPVGILIIPEILSWLNVPFASGVSFIKYLNMSAVFSQVNGLIIFLTALITILAISLASFVITLRLWSKGVIKK